MKGGRCGLEWVDYCLSLTWFKLKCFVCRPYPFIVVSNPVVHTIFFLCDRCELFDENLKMAIDQAERISAGNV